MSEVITFQGTIDECMSYLRTYQRITRAAVITTNSTYDEDGVAHPNEDIDEKMDLCDRRVITMTLKEEDGYLPKVCRDAYRPEYDRMVIERELFTALSQSTTSDDGQ